MAKSVKPPVAMARRSYDSTRRQQQAQATERVVLDAAGQLFLAQGYARTSLAEVARVAGVSVETVYGKFRNKLGLLHRLWDVTVGGDDQDVLLHDRPEVLAIRSEPDLEKRFRLHAAFMTRMSRRIGPFMVMVRAAAEADASAREMVEMIDAQRLAGLSVMAADAAGTGQLAVTEAECRDFVWSLADGVLWYRLVAQRGWTDARFEDYMATILIATLVRPGVGPTRASLEP